VEEDAVKKAICHFSFCRRIKEEKWTLGRFVQEVQSFRVDGLDFHTVFLPSPSEAPDAIRAVLKGSSLKLAGLSLSTNFYQTDPLAFRKEIKAAAEWICAAGKAEAPVSRIFGGHIDRKNKDAVKNGLVKVMQALKELAPVAEQANVVLALENHGGLPCTGEEQIRVIEEIDSPFLRATIDVGNYMQCGQTAVEGTQVAAKYCAYVHLKDFKRIPDSAAPAGTKLQPVILGKGDVDHRKCLEILKEAEYTGFVVLEYEGIEPETKGVPESIKYMRQLL